MPERKNTLSRLLPMGMALVASCLQPCSISYAADVQGQEPDNQLGAPLKTEQPVSDSTPITKPVLNGQVSRVQQRTGEDPNLSGHLPGSAESATIPAKMDLHDARALDQADIQKALSRLGLGTGLSLIIGGGQTSFINLRAQRASMSSDDYRKLDYGVIGLESVVQLDGSGPVVTNCFPTCPATIAGIRPGDRIVKAGDYAFKRGDGQRVLWQKVGGKADTPIDITVLRDGELITFHLMRMNIEDIEDERIRRTFEALLSALGPAQ